MRHCAVSLMLASGVDIAVVSKWLGQASLAIAADVYGYRVGTVASDAVNGAANLIARTSLAHEDVSG
jgi:integrase